MTHWLILTLISYMSLSAAMPAPHTTLLHPLPTILAISQRLVLLSLSLSSLR